MKASLGLWSEIRHLMMCIHWTMTQTLRDGDEQSVLCYRSLSWVCCCYNLDVMILQFWVDYFCHYIIDLIIFLSLLISSGVIFLSLQFCCRNSFAMFFFCYSFDVIFCHYSFDVIFLSLQFWCGEWDRWSRRPGGDQSVQSTAATEPAPEAGLLPVSPGQRLRPVPQVHVPTFFRTERRVSTIYIHITDSTTLVNIYDF